MEKTGEDLGRWLVGEGVRSFHGIKPDYIELSEEFRHLLNLYYDKHNDHLARLRLGHVAERIDALLSDAAKKDITYLDFLDGLLAEELASKQRKRIAMHVQIAHFPVVKTLEDFDFKFQPSIDQTFLKESPFRWAFTSSRSRATPCASRQCR